MTQRRGAGRAGRAFRYRPCPVPRTVRVRRPARPHPPALPPEPRELGVRGFPTAILQNAEGYALLTSGWQPFEDLAPQIDQWLASSPQYAS
ncbi:MAG: hypothetical protein MZW92_38725 [Comamonadaceae bacterium]|nr:hypothetical protein [Comamonadaceae bacterium]